MSLGNQLREIIAELVEIVDMWRATFWSFARRSSEATGAGGRCVRDASSALLGRYDAEASGSRGLEIVDSLVWASLDAFLNDAIPSAEDLGDLIRAGSGRPKAAALQFHVVSSAA